MSEGMRGVGEGGGGASHPPIPSHHVRSPYVTSHHIINSTSHRRVISINLHHIIPLSGEPATATQPLIQADEPPTCSYRLTSHPPAHTG